MKNQWNQFPFVLRRKILLTFLAGLASIALSLIIFIITTDHILLVLGSIIFLASLVLVRSLWSTIARGQYEIVEGVCSSVVSPMMRQYRKIQLIDEQGAERTLLLSKSAKFQIGARYRFYFQSSNHPTVGNDYAADPRVLSHLHAENHGAGRFLYFPEGWIMQHLRGTPTDLPALSLFCRTRRAGP